jgi:hypothetical protein
MLYLLLFLKINREKLMDRKNLNSSVVAWIVMLIASSLSSIFWRLLIGEEPYWWYWVQSALLLTFFTLTFIKAEFKALKGFILILLVTYFLGYGNPAFPWGLIPLIHSSSAWVSWSTQAPWALTNMALHLLRLTPALIIMAFLLLSGMRRQDFFLAKGKIDAPAEPSRLIGMKRPQPWTQIGTIFVIVFSIGTCLSLILSSPPSLSTFMQALPLIPVAILIAAINGFNEEFTLRAAPLSKLLPTIGRQNSLWITTLFFSLGHFYGVPSGVLGVILSSFLGWFLGKSILETKGFFWAWLSHFCADIFIFTFATMEAAV